MKAGDKVRVTRKGFGHNRTATVIDNPDDHEPEDVSGVWLRFDDGASRGHYWFKFTEIEPVSTGPDLKIKTAAEKVPLDLIPLHALAGTARVFQHGGAKYEPGNFLLAQDDDAPRRYAGALLRHLSAAQDPNGLVTWASIAALDEESGLPDLDHAIASLIMLRAAAIKKGALPADPGVSNLIKERK
jgi:hypothetical protein